ncbi:YehS family protein [Psychroflexus sediminis]|uniref:Uncharacterized conserved protein YehS, DUF1456 family n=1 Tax=Psychroflexus sediminis TaxID=470826 RepID=A0A1G7VFI3_9FLAO|nr:DUF1456 family protein [Psychroflexus sediminis]SDG58457.1 Uncharacterized conserved protein YehS, DUF1456 family [Psychroflexus sediminis]
MTNNDVLRRLRYTFEYTDSKMMSFFKLAGVEVSRAEVSDWLKSDDDEAFAELDDKKLAAFLNGLIIAHRGKKEGKTPENETFLNNNDVLKKLKIAYELKSEDLIELFQLAGKKVSKHELSSFMRRPTQPQYRELMDQYLRNFLYGLQLKQKAK